MADLFVIKKHNELLPFWRERNAQALRVLHVDFHDDLRGFLVDRKKGLLHRTGIIRENDAPPDEGNFLGHAVMEGIIKELHWVRGRIGGRAFDSGIVKYESDWAGLPHRMGHRLRGGKNYPLKYTESIFEEWTCPEGDWVLDLDWDFFASLEYDPKTIRQRFDRFMVDIQHLAPKEIYLCYSPDYVHPTQALFKEVINRLSSNPVWLTNSFLDELPLKPPKPESLGLKNRLIRTLRKRGIF